MNGAHNSHDTTPDSTGQRGERPGARGVVLITGAAKRIGASLATFLAGQGWNIGLHHRHSAHEAEALAQTLRAKKVQVAVLQADLMDLDAVQTLVPACTDALGPVTCLINNASLFEDDALTTLTAESWQNHLDTNLRAPAFLSRDFVRQLPKGRAGNIINIIDQRVWALTPRFFSYTLAKSALWTMTQTLAQECAPDVRVNGIGPGPVLKSHHQSQAGFQRQKEATLLGHGATAGEIASAVQFILETPALTGQMIALDGGQHLAWETPDSLEEKNRPPLQTGQDT